MVAVCNFAASIHSRMLDEYDEEVDEAITQEDFLNSLSGFLKRDRKPEKVRNVAEDILQGVNLSINVGMEEYMGKLISQYCVKRHFNTYQRSLEA